MLTKDWEDLLHLNSEEVCDYVSGEASDDLKEWVEVHIVECEDCRVLVETMRRIEQSPLENPIPIITREEKKQFLVNLQWRLSGSTVPEEKVINISERKKDRRLSFLSISIVGTIAISLIIGFAIGVFVESKVGFFTKLLTLNHAEVAGKVAGVGIAYSQMPEYMPHQTAMTEQATMDKSIKLAEILPLDVYTTSGEKPRNKSEKVNSLGKAKIKKTQEKIQKNNQLHQDSDSDKPVYLVNDFDDAVKRMRKLRTRGRETGLIQKEDRQGHPYYLIYRKNQLSWSITTHQANKPN